MRFLSYCKQINLILYNFLYLINGFMCVNHLDFYNFSQYQGEMTDLKTNAFITL